MVCPALPTGKMTALDVPSCTALSLGRPDRIIVIDRELHSFYEFLKPRQESECGTLVVLLDRRQGDRRKMSQPGTLERRQGGRRAEPAGAAGALMAVLGFVVLHRDGDRYIP